MEDSKKETKPLVVLPTMDLHTTAKGTVINFTCCSSNSCILKRINFSKPEIIEFLEHFKYKFEDFILIPKVSKSNLESKSEEKKVEEIDDTNENRVKVAKAYTDLFKYLKEIEEEKRIKEAAKSQFLDIPKQTSVKTNVSMNEDLHKEDLHEEQEQEQEEEKEKPLQKFNSNSNSIKIAPISKDPNKMSSNVSNVANVSNVPNVAFRKKEAKRKISLHNFKNNNKTEEQEILLSYKNQKQALLAKIANRKLIPIKDFKLNLNINKFNSQGNFPAQVAGYTMQCPKSNYFKNKKCKEMNSAKKLGKLPLIQTPQKIINSKDFGDHCFGKFAISGKIVKPNIVINPNQIVTSREESKRNFTPDLMKIKKAEEFLIKKRNCLNPLNFKVKSGELDQAQDQILKKSPIIPSLFKP